MLDNKLVKQASKEILLNTYQEICKMQKHLSNPKESITYTNVKKFERRFTKGYNRVGESIFFPTNTSYEKFYVPVNLYCASDNRDRIINRRRQVAGNKVTLNTIYDRGKLQRPTLSVYVNGIKVPDRDVYLTVYNGTTEVYFESFYLEEGNDNTVFITKDAYGNLEDYKYNCIVDTIEDNAIQIPSEFKNKHFSVYVGGYFLPESRYKIIDDKMVFGGGDSDGYEVEVRMNGKYHTHHEVYSTTGLINTLSINLDIPFSKDLLEVYVEGRRVEPSKLTELSPKYFEVDVDKSSLGLMDADAVEICYNIHYVHKKQFEELDYNDPYNKALQFFNPKRVEEILYKKYSDETVASYLKTKRIKEKYIPEYLPELDPRFLEGDYYDELLNWIKEYLKINPHYLKLFLEQFRYEETKFDYCYPDKYLYTRTDTSKELSSEYYYSFDQKMVVYQFTTTHKKFIERVFVNRKLLSRDDYILERRYGTNHYMVYIKETLIGDNFDVTIELESGNILGHVYDVTDINDVSGDTYFFSAEQLGEDLSKLQFSYNTDENPLFVPMNKDDLDITLETLTTKIGDLKAIKVVFKNGVKNEKQLCAYNPYHVSRHDYSKSDLEEDVILPLFKDKTIPYGVPFVELQDNIEVYYNGRLLFEGQEYGIQIPDGKNRVDYPYIIFKFIPEKNKKITVITKENRNPVVRQLETIPSKYGIVYMGDIKIPFSMKYFDVYLNGIKLLEEEVEVYALNLFKVKNVESKNYLYLKSKLTLDDITINEYIEICQKVINDNYVDSYEKFIDSWFKRSTGDNLIEDINKSEGGNDKVEEIIQDIIPNLTPPAVELDYDLGLNELAKAWIQGVICKRLDANKPDEKLVYEHFWRYLSDPEIRLNANLFCIIVDGTIDTNVNYRNRSEIGQLFANEIADGTAVPDSEGNIDFSKDPISDYIYIENEIVLDANEFYEDNNDVIVLDPNI